MHASRHGIYLWQMFVSPVSPANGHSWRSFANIGRAFRVIRDSGARYLITTTFLEHATNVDVIDGNWRLLNLERAPFNLSSPVAVLVEGCDEEGGAYADKALAAWRVSDLPV